MASQNYTILYGRLSQNEPRAKDTSKKVRAVKKTRAERGERLGGRPPYGYRKKSLDSKETVPDEETAPIIQLCAGGKGPNQIARILTEEQILTPANYAYQKEGKSHNHVDITRPSGQHDEKGQVQFYVLHLRETGGQVFPQLSPERQDHLPGCWKHGQPDGAG